MADAGEALVRRVLGLLTDRDQTLATCESLTGGMLSAALTRVPGSSAVFRGGLVTYATDLKASLAGVDDEVLQTHGAVSGVTAEAMAAGARTLCGSDWAVAVTGVAGPDPQEGHPPGTVFVGIDSPAGLLHQRMRLNGDRKHVRTGTVLGALDILVRLITLGQDDRLPVTAGRSLSIDYQR